MNKRVLLLGIVMLMSLLFSSTVFAGAQDFELINNTGKAITHVYVSPSNVNDWQEDVLGRDILESGDSVHITFSNGERATNWDIKATYANGNERYWEKFNLKSISTIMLQADGSASYE